MYAVSANQMQIVRDEPENFVDGLVTERSLGEVIIHCLNGQDIHLRVYEAPADCDKFCVGEPVAYHPAAELLAIRNNWISARVVDS